MLPDERPEFLAAALGSLKDYNHDLVNVPAMWRRTKGQRVRVAVLDTGMPMHKDLTVFSSKTFVDGYLEDKNGHATAVGSIIAGKGNGGNGILGIAPDADIAYGAVLNDCGAGSMSNLAKAIRWAVDDIHADVVNLSLGVPNSFGCDPLVMHACNYAAEHGVTVVAAAGNDASEVNWPAALDSVIAVAAVDRDLRPASFSARGPEVEFAAGGVSVMTAYKDNGYASMSGTSFSAPVIAGIAALIISEAMTHGPQPSPEQVRERLKSISYDIADPGRDDRTGWGIPVFTKESGADGGPGVPNSGSWLAKLLRKLRFW